MLRLSVGDYQVLSNAFFIEVRNIIRKIKGFFSVFHLLGSEIHQSNAVSIFRVVLNDFIL